jgi:hypothetical protein
MPIRFLVIAAVMSACAAPQKPVVTNSTLVPEDVQASLDQHVKRINTARDAARAKLASLPRADGQLGVAESLPSVGRILTSPADRIDLFEKATTMICGPIEIAAVFKTFAEGLSLFDVAEAAQVGKWMDSVSGVGVALGGALTAIGFALPDGAWKTGFQATGGLLATGGGIFGIVGGTSLSKVKLIQETVVRVEFNRQFSILIRQYTPTIEANNKSCADIRDYVTNTLQSAPGGGAPTPRIDGAHLDNLKKLYEGLGQIHDGLVKIGGAAQDVYAAMTKSNVHSSKVEADLQKISETTQATRKGWEQDRVTISKTLDCIEFCQDPAAPTPGPH